MITFYDLTKLEALACNDHNKFIEIIEHWYSKRIVPKRGSKYNLRNVNISGNSFILNLETLLEDKSTDIVHKVQYLKLAAYRDYTLYKQYRYTGLQRSYYPDLNVDAIKHNPLLKITQSEILFKYE